MCEDFDRLETNLNNFSEKEKDVFNMTFLILRDIVKSVVTLKTSSKEKPCALRKC